ncbi:hypothetical protein L5515_015744 [Caenorhabditis briggsae]|uniref:BTB domain-containing protein n=1 Tax=Caenorhabditis briggsae TaxID=6238 RepID=A0AAE9JAC9_CAEBR|nr:hypothetical protein L5515_015744 [Caenorhabditis briggsae]
MPQPNARQRARRPSGAPQPMDFTGTKPSLSDGIVLVDGQKFYISKTHLFRHSMFFKNMFFEKGVQEGNEEMVELKEATAEGFQIFLELINGQNRLSDENIEAVTKCSAICQSDIPSKKCLKFLQKKSKLSKTEKFLLADKLDFIALKRWLLSDVKTNEDMDGLLPPLDLSAFKPNTVELIAKTSLSINGVDRPPRPIEAPVRYRTQRNGASPQEMREILYNLGRHINQPWARRIRDERNPLNDHDNELLSELNNIQQKIRNGPAERSPHRPTYGSMLNNTPFASYRAPGAFSYSPYRQ